MTDYCAYLYRDPKTGVWRYVGEGKATRPYEHLSKSQNVELDRMLKKRIREGFDPQPVIIDASSKEDGQEMEMLLIAMIGRKDLGLGPLFNYTDGGDGKNQGPELRALHSATKKAHFQNPLAREVASEAAKKCQPEIWARPGRRETQSDAMTAYYQRPDANRGGKPCTIDGINFYESGTELAKALTHGKKGRRHPDFSTREKGPFRDLFITKSE